ncbi:MAG: Maf family protein, partial [Candidatus Tumulicola sp.]
MAHARPLTRIILASTSPRRLELLHSLGLAVEPVPSGYDEPPIAGIPPSRLARAHARAKLVSALA